jgi:hypothetical protein
LIKHVQRALFFFGKIYFCCHYRHHFDELKKFATLPSQEGVEAMEAHLHGKGREVTLSLQFIEHGFEQETLGIPLDESGAKFAEDRKMKSLIIEFQVKCILPIDTRTHRFSGLPVGKSFGELQKGHQR